MESNHSEYKNGKQTVCVDLDGVLHRYTGWKGPELEHYDEPMPGAREFMQKLKEVFWVVVYTSRQDVMIVKAWLEKHDIPFDTICGEKVPAVCYIDDRAIPFMGSFDGMFEVVRDFRPWWEW